MPPRMIRNEVAEAAFVEQLERGAADFCESQG